MNCRINRVRIDAEIKIKIDICSNKNLYRIANAKAGLSKRLNYSNKDHCHAHHTQNNTTTHTHLTNSNPQCPPASVHVSPNNNYKEFPKRVNPTHTKIMSYKQHRTAAKQLTTPIPLPLFPLPMIHHNSSLIPRISYGLKHMGLHSKQDIIIAHSIAKSIPPKEHMQKIYSLPSYTHKIQRKSSKRDSYSISLKNINTMPNELTPWEQQDARDDHVL